jgi:hypothetical protein
MKKKLAVALCLAATLTAYETPLRSAAAAAQVAPELPNTILGHYWCFSRATDGDPDQNASLLTPADNFDDCGNHGGVRFWRRGGFQLGRFDWRANCQISKIDLVGQKVYRVYGHCRSNKSMFMGDPLEGNKVFEIWQQSKMELRWRELEVATPASAANRPYYLCDKQLIVQSLEKDTGKTHYYLVLDKIKWWSENDWNVTRVLPDRLINFNAQYVMYYRGRNCHELTDEERDALLRKYAKPEPSLPPLLRWPDPAQAYKDWKASHPDPEEPPLPPQPYVHRNYEQWKALGWKSGGRMGNR